MEKLNLSLILSLIGCVTGCAGLAINFHKFLSEQFKLKVIFDGFQSHFFSKQKQTNCKTNFQGLVRINFINKSSSPVTIYQINASLNGEKLIQQKYSFAEIRLLKEVFNTNKYSQLIISIDKQIELPLRIQPYDSYEVFLFYPFFVDTENNTENINFTFKTTKRTFSKNFKISKFETIVHNNDNNDCA